MFPRNNINVHSAWFSCASPVHLLYLSTKKPSSPRLETPIQLCTWRYQVPEELSAKQPLVKIEYSSKAYIPPSWLKALFWHSPQLDTADMGYLYPPLNSRPPLGFQSPCFSPMSWLLTRCNPSWRFQSLCHTTLLSPHPAAQYLWPPARHATPLTRSSSPAHDTISIRILSI